MLIVLDGADSRSVAFGKDSEDKWPVGMRRQFRGKTKPLCDILASGGVMANLGRGASELAQDAADTGQGGSELSV